MSVTHFNRAEFWGASGMPTLSESGRGPAVWAFPVECARLSGAVDRVNVRAMKSYFAEPPQSGEYVRISGELRSYNDRSDPDETGAARSHLVITLFARSISRGEPPEPKNSIELSGAICRAPVWRRTPLGREICDVMLAVNRPLHAAARRSDYLPCIAWGSNARDISLLPVGSPLAFSGRIQSREYIKRLDDAETTRTAYEVSIGEIL